MRRRSLSLTALLAGTVLAVPTGAAGDAVPSTTPATPATASAAVAATTPSADAAVAGTTPSAGAAAAPVPSAFSVVGKAAVARGGTITLTVQAPATGKFTAFATIPGLESSDAAFAAKVMAPTPWDDTPLPLPYGNNAYTAGAGQPAALVLRPGKAARAAIKRLHGHTPLRVTVAVSFGPAGGAITTTVYVVKVYRPLQVAAAKKT